jgi:hypothetical protein
LQAETQPDHGRKVVYRCRPIHFDNIYAERLGLRQQTIGDQPISLSEILGCHPRLGRRHRHGLRARSSGQREATNWTSVRKVKEGETTNDLYAFLTTEPNAEVGAIHPKAMPVILTTSDEVETDKICVILSTDSICDFLIRRPKISGRTRLYSSSRSKNSSTLPNGSSRFLLA